MPETFKKKRIFQVAKELNISHLEILTYLEREGTPVDSHMAPVTPEVYDEILLEFSKDKLQIERHRKEQARKVVVSKIQQKQSEEDGTISEKEPSKKTIRKLKTSLKDETIALSDKFYEWLEEKLNEDEEELTEARIYQSKYSAGDVFQITSDSGISTIITNEYIQQIMELIGIPDCRMRQVVYIR